MFPAGATSLNRFTEAKLFATFSPLPVRNNAKPSPAEIGYPVVHKVWPKLIEGPTINAREVSRSEIRFGISAPALPMLPTEVGVSGSQSAAFARDHNMRISGATWSSTGVGVIIPYRAMGARRELRAESRDTAGLSSGTCARA